MKKGYFSLHIIKENENELYAFQGRQDWGEETNVFKVNKRTSPNRSWVRLERKKTAEEIREYWIRDAENEISTTYTFSGLSSGLNIVESTTIYATMPRVRSRLDEARVAMPTQILNTSSSITEERRREAQREAERIRLEHERLDRRNRNP